MESQIPEIVRTQFRSRRNVALPLSALDLFYSDDRYSNDIFIREVTNKLPSLRPVAPRVPSEPLAPRALSEPLAPRAPLKPLEPLAPRVPLEPRAPLEPRTYACKKTWAELFVPRSANEFFGQDKPLVRCKSWLDCGDFKSSVLVLSGPSGTGKTSLARFLLPNAMELNFANYEHAALRFCLLGGKSYFNASSKSFAGLIIYDLPCLPATAQKYIFDIVHHLSKTTFPLPIIFVLSELSPSFSRITKTCSLRVAMNRLSQKMLLALGYSLLRKTGHSLPNQYAVLQKLSQTSCNAHHFICALEDTVTGHRSNFFGATDTTLSPFELVRNYWSMSYSPLASIEALDSCIVHWLAENTPQLLSTARSVSFFCDSISEWDSLCGRLSYGERQATENTDGVRNIAMIASLTTKVALREAAVDSSLFREVPVSYPKSIRCVPVSSPSLNSSKLVCAFNSCF